MILIIAGMVLGLFVCWFGFVSSKTPNQDNRSIRAAKMIQLIGATVFVFSLMMLLEDEIKALITFMYKPM